MERLPPTSFQARPILAIPSLYEWVTGDGRMPMSTDLAMNYRQQLEIDLTEASIGQLPPTDEPPLTKAALKARNVGAVQWHPKILVGSESYDSTMATFEFDQEAYI